MAGRNDPCPCGSGEKYKKCCLAKDQAARAQAIAEIPMPELPETDTPLDYFEPESILKYAADSDFPLTPEADPLLERINAFWEQFIDAPYEKQWFLVTEMLAEEPELCGGEMVFEIANTMFGQAVTAGETERYQQLLDLLEKVAPEAYAEEIHYILDWRIQIALADYGRRPKRKRRKKSYYALCPDAQTLDRYLVQRVGFMSFRHYEAFALFELLPA